MTDDKKLVRLGVFIDGPNNSEALSKAGLTMNYASFLVKLRRQFDIVTARYYSGISDSVDHEGVREFLSVLSKNGYVPVTRPAKRHPDGSIKANLDVELAVDMIMMAPRLDKIMLFSGDGDFTYLVDAVQRLGIHVTVCTHKPFLSAELRRQCDEFLDLRAVLGKKLQQENEE
jgi:uncharacterized LabA/DUF88 family protein